MVEFKSFPGPLKTSPKTPNCIFWEMWSFIKSCNHNLIPDKGYFHLMSPYLRRLATPNFSDTTTWAATGDQDLKLSIKLSLYWSVMVLTVIANTKIRDKVRPTPTQCHVVFGHELQQFDCWSSKSGAPGSFEAWTANNNLDCAQLWHEVIEGEGRNVGKRPRMWL